MDAGRPPICLGHAGDACVLGVVERMGNALYLASGVRSASLVLRSSVGSILPEPIEAVGAQLAISHRVAAAMAQHVRTILQSGGSAAPSLAVWAAF